MLKCFSCNNPMTFYNIYNPKSLYPVCKTCVKDISDNSKNKRHKNKRTIEMLKK